MVQYDHMKNNATLVYSFLLILGDFLALVAAFTIAYVLRVKIDARPLVEQIAAFTYLRAFLVVLPLWIIVHASLGLYNNTVFEKRFSELGRLVVGSFLGILVVIGYDFITDDALFPARLVALYGFILGFTALLGFRTLARIVRTTLFRYGYGVSNVLIIGNTPATMRMAELICNTASTGQRVIGLIGRTSRRFTNFSSIEDAVNGPQRIHSIIQTELYKNQDKNNEILQFARQNHVAYRFVPGNTDLFVGNITVELFSSELPVVAIHQTALVGWGRLVKRLFDIFVSASLLIILAPLFVLVALLIKIFDPKGPVMFKQDRLTRFSRTFVVHKFRTVKQQFNGLAPEQAFEKLGKPELAKAYRKNGDFLPNDPRFGKFNLMLRATSLDELPQLFNVLKGDTSLVGPRSLIPQELSKYEQKHSILSVKSGLTGLAQISGRRDITFDERRKLDIYYVQNWSFWGDIVILIKTIRVVFFRTGSK